jgi:hypothetical protein
MFSIKVLCLSLLGTALLPAARVVASPGAGDSPVALLSDEECWRRMPAVESGGGQPVPSWAKAVATSLPRTAAAMLELDWAQRTKSPVDPVLRSARECLRRLLRYGLPRQSCSRACTLDQ